MVESNKNNEPKVVIIGSGPCGLGAAYRLQELGHSNFLMLDQANRAGGLARSDIDSEGFYWDYGGHVVFSHYNYFDKVLDLANPDWISHQREAWVWMRDRWLPYPVSFVQPGGSWLTELKLCQWWLTERFLNVTCDYSSRTTFKGSPKKTCRLVSRVS